MRKDLDLKSPDDLADWEGNNAAFACPCCGKVFIVSGAQNIHNGKRSCPKCGQATATITKGKKSGGSASISW